MTNAALTRPSRRPAYRVGQTVVAPDRYHTDMTQRRPHLVVAVRGDEVQVAEWTHTPQGTWRTTQLPSRGHDHSYLALRDFRTGRSLLRWVPAAEVDGYRRQLRPDTARRAVAYALQG